MKSWFFIAAKGFSENIPRKYLRRLAKKPLLAYCIETALEIVPPSQIIIFSEDVEILDLASSMNVFGVCKEIDCEAESFETLMFMASKQPHLKLSSEDLFFLLKPEYPFISKSTILNAQKKLLADCDYLVARSENKGLNDKSIEPSIGSSQASGPKLNQWSDSAFLGSRAIGDTKNKDVTQKSIQILSLNETEGIEIKTFSDWAIAEFILKRKKIVLRTDAAKSLGMGHVYRCLAIAQELSMHEIEFYLAREAELGKNFLEKHPFKITLVDSDSDFLKICEALKPDLCIVDKLDSEEIFMKSLKANVGKLVTFEDLGPGAQYADLVISDLYKNPDIPANKQLAGIEYALLAPGFETAPKRPRQVNRDVEEILVIFGGTDPSNLTNLALEALSEASFKGKVSVVRGLGCQSPVPDLKDYGLNGQIIQNVPYMPAIMRNADFAISSAGRTLAELMTFGIPTLCLCQNNKELAHTHASAQFGIINIGLGSFLDIKTVSNHIKLILDNCDLRQKLSQRALAEISERSNRKVLEEIFRRLDLSL